MVTAALRLVWRAELRRRWRSWLLLTLVAGLLFGLVLTIAVAADRADTTVSRYREATREEHAEVDWLPFAGGPRPDLGRVTRLHEVEAAGSAMDVVSLGLVTDAGKIAHVGDFQFEAPVGPGYSHVVDRPLLLAGRAPSPQRPDEVMVDQVMAAALDLDIGSHLRVRMLTRREGRRFANGEDEWIGQADPSREGSGKLIGLRVVGINARLDDGNIDGELVTGPGFAKAYQQQFGYLTTPFVAVRLRRSDALPAFLRDAVGLYPRSAHVLASASAPFGQAVASAIAVLAKTVWLLACAAGLMAVFAVAPALARRTQHAAGELAVLRVLGARRRDVIAASMVGPMLVAGGGAVVAALLSVAASPLTALRVSRTFDPSLGVWIDVRVILVGAAALTVGLLTVGVLAASRDTALDRDERSAIARVGWAGARFDARFGAPLPVALGLRDVLGYGARRTRAPVVSTTAAIAAIIMVVSGGLVVATSATRLLGEPRLYGQTYDIVGGVGGQPARVADRTVRRLQRDRAVTAASANGLAAVTIDHRPVNLLGVRQIKGELPFSMVSGRLPRRPGEIALGRTTMQALGVHVGDAVEVRGSGRSTAMRVTGVVVLPSVSWASQIVGIGNGGVVTFGQLRTVEPDTTVSRLLVRTKPSVDPRGEVDRLVRDTPASWAIATKPWEITKVAHVRSVPYFLVALIAVAGIAALAHLLIATTRQKRREISILKALGLSRRSIRASVFVQSVTTVVIGCFVGLPLGVAAGFWIWDAIADRMGVVRDPALPATIALLVPIALGLCTVVAALPALLAARVPAAATLRAE